MNLLAKSDDARAEAIKLSEKKRITGTIAKQLLAKHQCEVIPQTVGEIKSTRPFTQLHELPDGFLLTLTGPTKVTTADQLSMLLHVVGKLRDQLKPPAATLPDDTGGSGWLRRKAG
jgi:hypothetical protein